MIERAGIGGLAVVATHPIQYFAPWFRWLDQHLAVPLRVFYLDHPAARGGFDQEFGQAVAWDTPLTEGYAHEWVPNRARDPGSHHYGGLHNPDLWGRLARYSPVLTLLMGYRYRSLLPALLRRRLAGPTVLRGDSHLLGRPGGAGRWLSDRVVGRAFSALSGALCVGQHNRAYFRHHGIADERLFPSPPAIDLARFRLTPEVRESARALRARWGVTEGHRVVLFAGKLTPIKQPELLIRAFERARLRGVTLVLVGAGELEEALRAQVAQNPAVRLVGFCNQSQMPATYAAADLLVLPSSSETWGLAVNEAFALGVPALVSDAVGCAPDLIDGRQTGARFPAGDEAALSAALAQALGDAGQLETWGRNAQRLVREEFTYQSMTKGLEQALAAVAASPSTKGSRQRGAYG